MSLHMEYQCASNVLRPFFLYCAYEDKPHDQALLQAIVLEHQAFYVSSESLDQKGVSSDHCLIMHGDFLTRLYSLNTHYLAL